MKCKLDGNALCITKDNFVNLQEDDAMFIIFTKKQQKEIRKFAQ